jgi:hypothetical protein
VAFHGCELGAEDKATPLREKVRSAVDRDFKDFDDTVNYFSTTTQESLEQPPLPGIRAS